ncbi:MAG: UDP-N-acetylglucosamine--N-acetylmuramyl-(pentapeptide) pyrophosphoryl-undecaprenol N-acetylglucosamine transferase [Actinomycetota bacterium]
MKVGIAAAGSGGHVYPALAVADALVELGLAKDDIVFFGGDRMEAETVPRAGYPFVAVDVHGIRRSLSIDNLKLPFKVRTAARRIAEEVESDGIAAMVVFGGYVSGPAGLAARKRRIPLVIHEANAVPGVANRLLAPVAETVYVAFAPATAKLKDAVVIGNPVRRAFEVFDRASLRRDARLSYGIDPEVTVLGVFGGSLGAAALNEIAEILAKDPDRAFEVLHVTGTPHFDDINSRASVVDGWHVVAFEEQMERLYAAVDVVISRAGAMTISELHATATPAVVVPLPAGKGYQARNADDLVKAGGAVVIDQGETDRIIATAVELLLSEEKRKRMADTASASQPRGVARTIAEHVLEVARV